MTLRNKVLAALFSLGMAASVGCSSTSTPLPRGDTSARPPQTRTIRTAYGGAETPHAEEQPAEGTSNGRTIRRAYDGTPQPDQGEPREPEPQQPVTVDVPVSYQLDDMARAQFAHNFGTQNTWEQVQRAAAIDTDNNGTITFDEFSAYAQQHDDVEETFGTGGNERVSHTQALRANPNARATLQRLVDDNQRNLQLLQTLEQQGFDLDSGVITRPQAAALDNAFNSVERQVEVRYTFDDQGQPEGTTAREFEFGIQLEAEVRPDYTPTELDRIKYARDIDTDRDGSVSYNELQEAQSTLGTLEGPVNNELYVSTPIRVHRDHADAFDALYNQMTNHGRVALAELADNDTVIGERQIQRLRRQYANEQGSSAPDNDGDKTPDPKESEPVALRETVTFTFEAGITERMFRAYTRKHGMSQEEQLALAQGLDKDGNLTLSHKEVAPNVEPWNLDYHKEQAMGSITYQK